MKYLTFKLADQWCGIELSFVRELLGYMPFSPLAGEHPAVVGTFDLRGAPLRVIDFRVRFGLPATRTDETCMMIVETPSQRVALIVDQTVSLANLAGNASSGAIAQTRIDASCISGIEQVNGRTLILLDVARALLPAPMSRAA